MGCVNKWGEPKKGFESGDLRTCRDLWLETFEERERVERRGRERLEREGGSDQVKKEREGRDHRLVFEYSE